jgi:hypothetical protein
MEGSDTVTQQQAILDHLSNVGPLTHLDAFHLCDSWRLGARIYDLRKEGHDIHTTMIDTAKKRKKTKRKLEKAGA